MGLSGLEPFSSGLVRWSSSLVRINGRRRLHLYHASNSIYILHFLRPIMIDDPCTSLNSACKSLYLGYCKWSD